MAARNGVSVARTGKETERAACALLGELTGYLVKRKATEGIREDHGDLTGLPRTCVQVSRCQRAPAALWARARAKARDCQTQQARGRADYGVTVLKVNGGPWRAVLTAAQFDDITLHGIHTAAHFELTGSWLNAGDVALYGVEFRPGEVLHTGAGVYVCTVERWAELWLAAIARDEATP